MSDHLRRHGVKKIGVWGEAWAPSRLYSIKRARRRPETRCGAAPPPIKHTTNAMVLDSPFADFCQLAEELVAKGRERGVVVPTVVTRLALSMLGTSVQSQAGFDIRDLSAIREVPRCRLPALFVCAKMDDFIGALAASHVGAFIDATRFHLTMKWVVSFLF